MARRLRDELAAERRGAESGPNARARPPAMAEVARRTGYSINSLSRFLAVFEWAESISGRARIRLKDIEEASFGSVEVVRRIWTLDPALGRDLLRQVVAGKIGAQRLRDALRSLAASKEHVARRRRQAGAADRYVRLLRAHEVLRAGVEELSGSAGLRWLEAAPPHPLSVAPYASFDGMAVKLGAGREIEWVDGFDLREIGASRANDAMIDALCRATVSATYFRRFFLVLIEPSAERLDWLTNAARDLEIRQVGIAAVEFEPRERLVLVAPPAELAKPDRRFELITALAGRI